MNNSGKPRLDREQMAAVAAGLLQPRWIVNLGVGIPTLASTYISPDSDILLTSENGLLGYGVLAPEGTEDIDVVNASVQYVTLQAGAAVVHHADSFAFIRSGHVDCTILGAYEVAMDGSFANWKTSNDEWSNLGGIGGAMDLVASAKNVFLVMQHTTNNGSPRLLKQCTLPLTAPAGTVTLIVTDIAILKPNGSGFDLLRLLPGWEVDDVKAMTGAPVVVSPEFAPLVM